MSASLSVQKAIRARLVGAATVTALVPAASVLDRNSRPAPDPAIILGEDQEVDEGRIDGRVKRVYSTLHIWKKEPSLVGVKTIAAAVMEAIKGLRNYQDASYQFGACWVSSARYLRDPDGETSHAVVTVETIVSEVA